MRVWRNIIKLSSIEDRGHTDHVRVRVGVGVRAKVRVRVKSGGTVSQVSQGSET